MPTGQQNAKLTDDQRLAIMSKLSAGATANSLAKEYGVNPTTIYRIRAHIANDSTDLVQPSAARVTMIKKNLLDLILGKLQTFYEALTPEKIEKSSAAQIAMMFGVFYDKYRLEAGKSTNNHAYSLQAVVEMSISPGGAAAIETKTPTAALNPTETRDSTGTTGPGADVTSRAAAASIIDAETVEAHETAAPQESQHTGAAVFPGLIRSEAAAVSSEPVAAGGAGAAVQAEDLL